MLGNIVYLTLKQIKRKKMSEFTLNYNPISPVLTTQQKAVNVSSIVLIGAISVSAVALGVLFGVNPSMMLHAMPFIHSIPSNALLGGSIALATTGIAGIATGSVLIAKFVKKQIKEGVKKLKKELMLNTTSKQRKIQILDILISRGREAQKIFNKQVKELEWVYLEDNENMPTEQKSEFAILANNFNRQISGYEYQKNLLGSQLNSQIPE
jgi:hypothetical protein